MTPHYVNRDQGPQHDQPKVAGQVTVQHDWNSEKIGLAPFLAPLPGDGSLIASRPVRRAPGAGITLGKRLFDVALALLLDRRLPARWRLPALGSLLMGTMLLVMGKSSGALVSTLGVVLAFGAIVLLQRLAPHVRLVVVAMAVVLATALGIILSFFATELSQMFLDLTGKDVTLTGRTDLWAVAFQEIAERPVLGTGFQAFWVQGNPLAEQLWAMFGIGSRAGFHFHNTLISNMVEIGLVGGTLQAVIFFAALVSSLTWAIRSPSAASVFFALFMVRQFLLMWIEVAYFLQFELSSVITIAAVCYGHAFRSAQRGPASSAPAPKGRAGLPAVT